MPTPCPDRPVSTSKPVVFPIIWTTLYTDIAVTSAVVLERLGRTNPVQAAAYRRALAVNLVLNTSWSWVFFKGQQLVPAISVAAALAVSSADPARRADRAGQPAALALAPYATWCTFATVLTTAIWRRNR